MRCKRTKVKKKYRFYVLSTILVNSAKQELRSDCTKITIYLPIEPLSRYIPNCRRLVATPTGASAVGGACLTGRQVFTAHMKITNYFPTLTFHFLKILLQTKSRCILACAQYTGFLVVTNALFKKIGFAFQ